MLHVHSGADIFTATYPPLEYTVDGVLPVGLALLVGRAKIGKSWLNLQLARAVGSGSSFLDRDTASGRVLVLSLEDHDRRLQARLRLQGASRSDLDHVGFVTSLEGGFETLLKDLDDWVWAGAVPARLIIIDTFGRINPERPGGRADYDHAVQVLAKLQRLAFDNSLTVLAIHHQNKKQIEDDGDPFDSVLGSQGLVGTADTLLLLERPRLSDHGQLLVTGRDIAEQRIHVRFDERTKLWVPAVPSAAQALGATGRRAQVIEQLMDGPRTSKELQEALV